MVWDGGYWARNGDKSQKCLNECSLPKRDISSDTFSCVRKNGKKISNGNGLAGDATGVGICASALIVMCIRPIRYALAAVNSLLPIAVFIGMAAVAFIVRAFIKNGAIRRARRETETNVMRLPQFAKLTENGWFEVTTKVGVSPVRSQKSFPSMADLCRKNA